MQQSTPSKKKVGPGRPRTGKEVAVIIAARMPAEVARAVDAWAHELEISRSEAVARLVELGLTVKQKRP
jgi:hypothetical protein